MQAADGLIDSPVRVRAQGLVAGGVVQLTADATDASGIVWQSSATCTADGTGVVDTGAQSPSSGSYTGTDGTGLLWSMTPTGVNDPAAHVFDLGGPTTAGVLHLHVTARDPSGAVLAETRSDRTVATADVHLTTPHLADSGFEGVLAVPAAGPRRAGVVLIGGSDGGIGFLPIAELLASRGYPAVVVAYFNYPGLPPTLSNIPLEYFATAVRWFGQQPGVDPAHIVVAGASRGTEAAALVAADFPDLVHGLVAYVPSSVATPAVGADGPAWTLAGQPVPFLPLTGDTTTLPDGAIVDRPLYEQSFADAKAMDAAAIPVENSRGPVLLFSAGADQTWPSTTNAQRIIQRLDAHQFPYPHRQVDYPDAGHPLRLPPYLPAGTEGHSVVHTLALGGSVQANNSARVDAWQQLLNFLKHL